jgi:endonuclease YncB( thermonuclease family)
MLPPLRSSDLRHYQARLRDETACLEDALARLARQKAGLFREGAREDSERVRLALARQVGGVEAQMRGLRQTSALLERQNRLLGQLIFAEENADRLDRAPFLSLDWASLLGIVAEAGARQQSLNHQLDAVLAVLEPSSPSNDVSVLTAPAAKTETAITFLPFEVAQAISVPDGDGLKLEDGRRVRYIGINAPEMYTWENGPEPYAREARDLNSRLVTGQRVRLVKDVSETDRYGRLLRFVYAGDTLVNAEILRAGLARVLTVPPDCAMAREFGEIERDARQHRRGVWGEGDGRGV